MSFPYLSKIAVLSYPYPSPCNLIESDAKICVDALRKPTKENPWRIAVLITVSVKAG